MNRPGAFVALLASAFVATAAAEAPVAKSGDSFLYEGEEVRLADVLAPSNAERPEPFANEAKAVLDSLLVSRTLVVEDVMATDRWGRRTAKVSFRGGAEGAEPGIQSTNESGFRVPRDDARPRNDAEPATSERTIQEILVAAGAVRVRPEGDDHAFIERLLAIEAEARAAKRGLWGEWRYRVFDAENADGAVGAFNLVDGTVLTAVSRSGRLYLNFGADYRTDFTATAKPSAARKWAKSGTDLASLAGARLRVRGYVSRINGPSIEITHVRQVEVLAAPAGAKPSPAVQ